MSIKYNTENMTVAKRIFDTITRVLKMDADIEIKENLLKKKHSYTIVVKNATLLLSILGLEGNLLTDAVPPVSYTHLSSAVCMISPIESGRAPSTPASPSSGCPLM